MRPTLSRNILILSLGLLLFAAVPCRASVNVDSLYARAQQAYDSADFEEARVIATNVLYLHKSGMSTLQARQFHELLASALVVLNQREDALREFTELLKLDRYWNLGPMPPPKIKEVFDEARHEYWKWLNLPAAERLSPGELKFGASWRSAVLPGWGQFYKGQKVRGTAFMATQLLSLVALAVLQSEVNRQHDDYMGAEGAAAANAYGDYRNAWRTRNVVGYVTVGIYVASYLDALYSPPARK